MSTLGFEDYVEPLKLYLRRCREVRLCFQALFNVFSYAAPSTRARNQPSTSESLADIMFHTFYVYIYNLCLIDERFVDNLRGSQCISSRCHVSHSEAKLHVSVKVNLRHQLLLPIDEASEYVSTPPTLCV